MDFSLYGKKYAKFFATNFAIFSFASLSLGRLHFHVYFRLFRQSTIIEMPLLIRKEKSTCENCATQTKRNNSVRHKKRCSVQTLYCTHCPHFSSKCKSNLNYHIAKKHSAPKLDVTFKCKLCYQKFPGFYALRKHRNTQHGMQIGSRARDVDVEQIVGCVEDHSLRQELRSRQRFLADSELERARQKVFNYAIESLNAKIVNERFDQFLNNLKRAAKVNMVFAFFLKNIEDGGFRYFYAHENTTLLDCSKLLCTHDDSAKPKKIFNEADVIESRNGKRMYTKCMLYKLTNLTVTAALLKDVPMGCKDEVLTEPLLRNGTVNCLTSEERTRQPYNDNLCIFVLLLSSCMEIIDWKKKHLELSIHS